MQHRQGTGVAYAPPGVECSHGDDTWEFKGGVGYVGYIWDTGGIGSHLRGVILPRRSEISPVDLGVKRLSNST